MVNPDNKAKPSKLGIYIAIIAVVVIAAVAAYSLRQQAVARKSSFSIRISTAL